MGTGGPQERPPIPGDRRPSGAAPTACGSGLPSDRWPTTAASPTTGGAKMASTATDRSPAMEQQREGWRPRSSAAVGRSGELLQVGYPVPAPGLFFFAFFMILGEKLFTKLFIHFFKIFYSFFQNFLFLFYINFSRNFYFKNCAQNFVYLFFINFCLNCFYKIFSPFFSKLF
jgi:hypothetical protein